MNVVLLERGAPENTQNFPENPDPHETPVIQTPTIQEKRNEFELDFAEAKFGMAVAVEKYGGEVVLARVVGNLGEGQIRYREEISQADGFVLGKLQLTNAALDRVALTTRSVLPGMEEFDDTARRIGIPSLIPESLIAVDYIEPPQSGTLF